MHEFNRTQYLAVVEQRIAELKAQLHEPDDGGVDDALPADDEAARLDRLTSADYAVRVRALAELNQLRLNLAWLKSEEGGLCEVCAQEIPVARLLAVPTTRCCVGCADA